MFRSPPSQLQTGFDFPSPNMADSPEADGGEDYEDEDFDYEGHEDEPEMEGEMLDAGEAGDVGFFGFGVRETDEF